MEYQVLIIPFCFYSVAILQSQLTGFSYARQHLCARDEAFYLLQFKQGLIVDPAHAEARYGYFFPFCDTEAPSKSLSWNVTGDCCEWDGVTCDEFTGHVIGLDLSCNFLRGTINANSSLAKLGHLQSLNLAFNELDDFPLGNGISELTSLRHLNLSYCGSYVRETIPPGLFKLSKLVSLDLSRTQYHQIGPAILLQNLTNLEVLLFPSFDIPFELPKNLSSPLRHLDLKGSNLFGNIGDSNLFHLPNLQVLRLGDNFELKGILPNFNWNFSASILELDFSRTSISGKVPDSIGNLHSLRLLSLAYCNLIGLIPESIGNLTNIRLLHLSSNYFTGKVPSTISKLNKLIYLYLYSNNLQGPIPDIFANFPLPYNISGLQELEMLDLSSNSFTGAPPPWLFYLPSLTNLQVQDNQLTGKLPHVLKSHYSDYLSYNNLSSNMMEIDLSNNKLHGEIPDWMTSINLQYLDLSHNFLTGSVRQVWRSTAMMFLNLENNYFQDSLHQSICDMINLQVLILAHNSFSGTIPGCLGNSSRFPSALDLRMTNSYGAIPGLFGLQYLGLNGNQVGGQVPRSLVNCTSLQVLDLGNNKINDTFPIWLENLPNLQVLILKSNLFHGPIGDLKSQFPFPELQIFDLSFNGFTGTLPSNFFKNLRGMAKLDQERKGNFSFRGRTDIYSVSLVIKGNEYEMRITSILTSIDLSSNRFEGDIPKSVGSLSSLVYLNLSHNNFHGYIPAEIAKLSELEALDLSRNRLIGEIPGLLTSLTFLEVLNLSYNHLVGHIPHGRQFDTFSNDAYTGNPGLCGFPLTKECGENKNASPFAQDDDDDDSIFASGFTWKAVVIGYGCGMIFGLFMGSLMFLLEKPKWIVNFAEDTALKIAQEIAAKKRRRPKKRHGLRMN